MDTLLAKLRRRGLLSLLLGLLLFGNELAHLYCHEHLHAPSGESAHSVAPGHDGVSGLAASPHRSTEAEFSAGELPCPCCSSAIDRLCASAPAEPPPEPPSIAVTRRDPTPPAFRSIFLHQPRSPPLV